VGLSSLHQLESVPRKMLMDRANLWAERCWCNETHARKYGLTMAYLWSS